MQKKPLSPLVLSHTKLVKIFAAFHVYPEPPEPGESGLILFAFRGCLPAKTINGWSASLKLKPASLDYVHMRCTLGIWDPQRKRLFAAPGSTVPYKAQVEIAAARKGKLRGKGTNQLEPGFYTDLSKGEHLQGKTNGHQALRQTAGRFYRRSPTGLPYTEASPLYFGNPYDNLHCGWNLDGLAAGFSSAGCMVVAGIPHCPRRPDRKVDQGPWKIFHNLLYAEKQSRFPLLLLSFQTLFSAVAKPTMHATGLRRNLVFGSSGEAVRELQRFLSERSLYLGKINGDLDVRTYRAWKTAQARSRS